MKPSPLKDRTSNSAGGRWLVNWPSASRAKSCFPYTFLTMERASLEHEGRSRTPYQQQTREGALRTTPDAGWEVSLP